MPQFIRQIRVEVAGTVIRDLMVRFTIRKESSSNLPHGEIAIYNLNKEHEAQIIERGTGVTLHAGYRDQELALVFSGDLRRVDRQRERHDRMTVILVGGNAEAVQQGQMTETYDGDHLATEIITDLVNGMGEDLNIDNVTLQALVGDTMITDYAVFGSSKVYLDSITQSLGVRWYNEDGTIFFAKSKEQTTSQQSTEWEFSERNGMIGTPHVQDDGLRIRTVLNPSIKLEDTASVSSPLVPSPGPYKITIIEHSGDNWTGQWYSDLVLHSLGQESAPGLDAEALRSLLGEGGGSGLPVGR